MRPEELRPKRKCFCCGKKLGSAIDPENDRFSYPPDNATYWRTSGNYGSTVFDPGHEFEQLEIYICDGCLKSRASRAYRCTRGYKEVPAEEPRCRRLPRRRRNGTLPTEKPASAVRHVLVIDSVEPYSDAIARERKEIAEHNQTLGK